MKARVPLFLTLVITFGIILMGVFQTLPAHAKIDPEKITTDSKMHENVKTIYATLKEHGYGDAAKLAIMANINVESTFKPGVVNEIGCIGLFQYCFGRASNLTSKVPDWATNIEGQIKFMEDELPKTQILSTSKANMKGYPEEYKKNYTSVEDIKKETDWKILLNQWLTLWEIPCTGWGGCAHERAQREAMAESMKTHWKEIFGVEFGSDGGVSNRSDNCVGGIGQQRGSSGCKDAGEGKITLYGMPNISNLGEGVSGITFVTSKELRSNELLEVTLLKTVRNNDKEARGYSYIGIGVGILAILLMLWAVLIMASYTFDIAIGFMGFSLSKVVTLGKIDVIKEMAEPEGRPFSRITIMSFSIFILGACVLGGVMFNIMEFFYYQWQDWKSVIGL